MNLQETRRLTASAKHTNYEWESEEEASDGELNSMGYSILTLLGGIVCMVVGLVAFVIY